MTSIASSTPPDWEHIDENIGCPLCEYDLRGLSNPRCPECGYRFEWPDVLDPTRRLHPYLFEHHPNRNLETFRRTLFGGFRPRRFWTSLQPVQPSFPRRILVYWLLAASVLLIVLILILTQSAVVVAKENASFRSKAEANPSRYFADEYLKQMLAEYGSMRAMFDAEHPTGFAGAIRNFLTAPDCLLLILPYAVVLAWPWLTVATLLIFSTSMQRARINRIHILRCVLYSFDVVLWVGIGNLLFLGNSWRSGRSGGTALWNMLTLQAWTVVTLGILAWLYGSYRLWIAYRLYLRFPRSFATILASQIIVALAVACVAFALAVWQPGL